MSHTCSYQAVTNQAQIRLRTSASKKIVKEITGRRKFGLLAFSTETTEETAENLPSSSGLEAATTRRWGDGSSSDQAVVFAAAMDRQGPWISIQLATF